MGRFFNIITEGGSVKGERQLFVLNHVRMFTLQPLVVSTFFGPTENFPPSRSLFMPCYNFSSGKTHGYLIAVSIDGKWRIGILQHVDIQQDKMKIAHIAMFKNGTAWPTIYEMIQSGYKGHSRLLRYLEGHSLINPEVIPLVEISRRDSDNGPPIHKWLSKDKSCFEQPRCPDYICTLSHNDFQKLFGCSKIIFDVGMTVKEGFFAKAIVPWDDVELRNRRKRVAPSDDGCRPFNVVEKTAQAMKNMHLMDRDDVDKTDFHVYYVQPLDDEDDSSNEEHLDFLVPNIDVCGTYSHDGEVNFFKVSNAHKKELTMDKGYTTVDDYNQRMTSLCHGTMSLYLIDPSKHLRGFLFSMLLEGTLCSGEVVFRNKKIVIYHEKKQNVPLDSDVEGVVMFRGFPWYYDNSGIKEEHLKCLPFMHGCSSGMLQSRKSVDMVGYFSYTGPRATSQSTCSPNEPMTKGHDLYTKKNCPLTYPLGVRLARMLCRQSDSILTMSGNILMKSAVLANHHLKNGKDDEDEEEWEDCCDHQNDDATRVVSHLSYEDICHNRIITKWFGSVSADIVFCLLHVFILVISLFFQTLHRDNNDTVINDIYEVMKQSCENNNVKKDCSSDERKICNYVQRVQEMCGKKISMATICCWKALEREKKMDSKNGQYIHFFCCESLGFALDISSLCLNKDGLDGSYGGSFSSSIVEHGTSVPLSMCNSNNGDIRVSVSPQQSCPYIPFAWGRTGGSKTTN